MCAAIVVPASRAALYDDPDALMRDLRGQAAQSCACSKSLGWEEVGRSAGRGREPGGGWRCPRWSSARKRVIGPAMTGLTYREPLHLVRGDGVWLIDADGRRYLDAYNNVPVVGHGHPRVVEAIVRQARR